MDTPESLVDHTPPHSTNSEQSVLGGLLLDNDVLDKIGDVVSEVDFYFHHHRLLYRHILQILSSETPADVITLAESLNKSGHLEKVGGLPYITSLVANIPSAANIRVYAGIVREKSILRKMVATGTSLIEAASHPGRRSAREILDEMESKVFEIAESNLKQLQGITHINPLLSQVIEGIDERFSSDSPDKLSGLPTGYKDLDDMTSGLHAGDLIIIAGRPSMGKSAIALNIAEHVALHEQRPVVIFSMEMPGVQLTMRHLASVGRINLGNLRDAKLKDEDWASLTVALGKLNNAPIYIDETGALKPMEMRAKARRLHRECQGLGLIVIDYIQLMVPDQHGENRNVELSTISRSLKAMAKELNVPVIALSQLSRKVEERSDKRPMLSDLRESGALEQDADLIMLMFREEYYNKDTKYKGIAEVNLGKQRNGTTGTINLIWRGEYCRFENLAFGINNR